MASIFDVFTGNNTAQAAQTAAGQQIGGINTGYGLASGDLNQAIQNLIQQYGLGQTALSGAGQSAGTAINSSATNAVNAVGAGANTATNAINAGTGNATNALTDYYTSALLPFMQNYGQATQGTTALGNSLGLNGGPAGASAAASAYASNPAYQFTLNQGDQNVLRNAAQTGTLASGGTLNALQQQGQGLANQTYQQYVQNLMPFLSQANTGAAGIGSTLTGLGSGLSNLFTGQGTNLANIATGTGTQLGNIYTGQGTNLANIDTGQGTQSANLSTSLGNNIAGQYGNLAGLGWQFGTGIGNANANATLATANAQNQGSANLWNAIGNGAKLATLAFSDARLKEDIAPVGELYDGTNVYRYRYKWDDPSITRLGLMAQEVEKTRPDAVAEVGGYKAVDYDKATNYASLLAKFQPDADTAKSGNDNAIDVFAKFLDAA